MKKLTPEQRARQQVVEFIKFQKSNLTFIKLNPEQEKRIDELRKQYNIKESELETL